MITNQAPDYAKVGSNEYYGNILKWLAQQGMGSAGGMTYDMFKLANALVHGDLVKAGELMPIKLGSDIVKAGAGLAGKGPEFESDRGVKRGAPYSGPEAVAKGLGFSLASTAERSARTFGQMQKTKEANNAKSDAVTAYIKNQSGPNLAKAIQAGATPATIKAAMRDVAVRNAQNNNGLKSTRRSAQGDADFGSNYYIQK